MMPIASLSRRRRSAGSGSGRRGIAARTVRVGRDPDPSPLAGEGDIRGSRGAPPPPQAGEGRGRGEGGAETGEVGVDTVTLDDVGRRHRLVADLVCHGALDDRPVHPTGSGLFLDILETAIDDRVDIVQLALRAPLVAPITPAARRS